MHHLAAKTLDDETLNTTCGESKAIIRHEQWIDYKELKDRVRSPFMVSFTIPTARLMGENDTASESPSPAAICQFRYQGIEKLNQMNTQVYPIIGVRDVGLPIPARRAWPITASSTVIATA